MCQLVSCRDVLYTLGGLSLNSVLSSVVTLQSTEADTFKKNPTFSGDLCLGDRWIDSQPMQKARHSFAAVNCNGFIYAIGGQSGQNTLKNVERYDPELEEWIYVADMIFKRQQHVACVLGEKIFVVGGRDEDGDAVQEIECYYPHSNSWSIVGTTDDELYGHSLIAL